MKHVVNLSGGGCEVPLVIQFSGGRTSAFMSKFLIERFPTRETVVLFENTGKEDEATLEFINECDRRWNLNVVWLEAVTHLDERKGCTHKIVNFETAARNGEPYEAMIQKYGICNMAYTNCTRELKINVAASYIRSLGLVDYQIAIGIRADERHRLSEARRERNSRLIYPLADMIQVDKKFINRWWSQQDFDLQLPHYKGNCDFCFKKPISRLVTLVRENPHALDWWEDMERKYGDIGAPLKPRVFFRKHHSAQDLRQLAAEPTLVFDPEMDTEYDCFCKAT